MNDARAKQALYMSKKTPKSSMGFGSGRAILFIVTTILVLGAALWFLLSML